MCTRTSAAIGLMSMIISGCTGPAEPIERQFENAITTVVAPAMKEALGELRQRTVAIQASGQLIEPGYVVEGHAGWLVGPVWRVSARLSGVSANLAGATQGDAGPDLVYQPTIIEPQSTKPYD